MTPALPPIASWLSAWLPPETHRGLARRGAVVGLVALGIALINWSTNQPRVSLDGALVYSCAISAAIWLLCDPARIALHRQLRTPAPHYWGWNARSLVWLAFGVVAGYILGISAGDLYTHQSSLKQLVSTPGEFWGVVLKSLGISLAFLFYFYQREKSLSLERQATEARLRLLETQLEPHMLFNTLANLRALIAVDPGKAVQMLDRLNAYLRATLRASRSDEGAQSANHTLAQEFQRLDDYLALMGVRMGDRLRHTLSLPPELAKHPVPPLLLQPLVENAIRHGLEPHIEGGDITVQALAEGAELVLTVSDTGAGCAFEPSTRAGETGAGFGLAQVRERLETAFGPATRQGQRLQWQSAPQQGTRITLRLPLEHHF